MAHQIDHRAFLAGLSAEDRRQLLKQSDLPGLVRFSVHVGAILLCAFLILREEPLYLLLLPVQAFLVIFLFTPFHETIHGTAFRTSWLNSLVAHFCGFVIALPAIWFHDFHFAHHRYTHVPGKDPELSIAKPETLAQYLVYVSGVRTWERNFRAMFRNALGRNEDVFVADKNRGLIRTEARIMILLYVLLFLASILLGSAALFWVWVLPALIGQPMLRAYLLAEHTGCPPSEDMFAKTRTTYTNALLRYFAWNMPYHAEHHVFSSVPFHKLPDLHRLTRPHLKVTENGYVRFHRSLIMGFR